MTITTDNITLGLIQKEIESYIGGGTSNLIFEYHEKEGKLKLDLITVNPLHSQAFLFNSVIGYDKTDVLNKMLDYVKIYKERESSYTMQWSLRGENELHTSYFRANSIVAALDKLFYGRDASSIIVFSAVLNPIS